MSPIEFSIPLRTVSESNTRQHWAQKAKRAKMQRQAVTLAARAAGFAECACSPKCCHWQCVLEAWTRKPTPHLWVTLTRIAPRELDTDNLSRSFKAIRDQVAVHLGIDDRSKDVAWQYGQRKGKPGEYGVDVRVVEAPSGEVKP